MTTENPEPDVDPLQVSELADGTARVIGMALRTAMAGLPLLLLATMAFRTRQEAAAVAVLLGVVVALYLVHRAGWPFFALKAFIASLIVYGAAGVAVYGSLRSAAALAFVAAIVVSGIFLRPKLLALVTATCVVTIGALTIAESSGIWPRPAFETGTHTWLTHSIVLAALAYVTYYGRSLMVAALRRLQVESAARERAQLALLDSEQLHRSTFELAGSGIALVDPAGGRLLRVNPRLCEMFGRTAQELVGQTFKALSHPDDRDLAALFLERLRVGERELVRLEKRYLRKDGSVLWATVSVALQRDAQGAPQHEVAVLDDITERRRAEAALRASEEYRSRVFSASPAAMTVSNFDTGALLDMNQAAEALTGVRRADALGKSVGMFYADAAERERTRERLVQESRLRNVPVTYRRPADGSLIETITSLELVSDGERRLAIAIIVDQTAEVRARAALRASEERFSRVFFALPVNLAINRVADGRYLEANSPPEQALGYDRQELLGRTTLELGIWTSEEDRERVRSELERDGRLIGHEVRLRHKSGEVIDCRIWATTIELEGVPCVLSSTMNVTAQKRRETLLLEVAQGVAAPVSADFFSRMTMHFARALDADCALVGEFVDRDRLRTLAAVAGGSPAPGMEYALAGSPCGALLLEPGIVVHTDAVAERFPGMPWLREVGARAYIGASLRGEDGAPIGVLAAVFRQPLAQTAAIEPLLRIFAARAQAELQRLRHDRVVRALNESLESRVQERTLQLQAAVRELEAFSYSVSHDLRAPLRAIGSFANMLAEGERERLSAEGLRQLDIIERNAVRMGQLIDELLQLARVPRLEPRRDRVDLGEIAAPLLATLRVGYANTAVQVGVLPEARGDSTLLLQVLANLLDNAFKFSQRVRAPRVELGWSEPHRAWYVRDNGVGFDMRHATKLFGTFERLHTEREFPGSGVGLAIVKRIVERHGGRVWAEAQPGAGATFYFNLGA